MNIKIIRSAAAGAGLTALGLSMLVLPSPTAAAPAPQKVRTLTLARVDRKCFQYPSAPGSSPVYPTWAVPSIRGGFDDPRGVKYAHFGVDVAAPHDRAKVYAVVTGRIWHVRSKGANARFILSPSGTLRSTRYDYWHVDLTRVAPGARVRRGQWIGRVVTGQNHVHLSEWNPVCGFIDPRRPTGILRDPANRERPSMDGLAAYVADEAAFGPHGKDVADASAPIALDALHGRVDFRARVWDMPVHRTPRWPQQPLMVAGLRSWIGSATDPLLRVSRPIVPFLGGRLIPPALVDDVYAPGTYRLPECFTRPGGTCATRLVVHVGGRGVDTTAIPNGAYQFCVAAVTIRNVAHHRCWPIAIDNPGAAG
jgi:murein DD-endopeptidase MepM/ murein hydrolase activator NlpD